MPLCTSALFIKSRFLSYINIVSSPKSVTVMYLSSGVTPTKCVGAIGVAVLCTHEEHKHFEEKEKLIKHNIIKARAEIGRRLKYS